MKVMYLDESGDHSLEKVNSKYPIFVLGGIIVEREYARTVIEDRVRKLKRDFSLPDDTILHTLDIARTQKGFEFLRDEGVRGEFYEAVNAMMRELEYQVVACVVKKPEHVARYGKNANDPYMYGLEIMVERFCFEIGDVADGGAIYAEKRRPDLDHELEMAWERLRVSGTYYVKRPVLDKRIIGLSLKDKRLNLAGLQLADLVVSPIGRAVMGKATHEDWEIVESKLCRRNGRYQGYGLVVLPKN